MWRWDDLGSEWRDLTEATVQAGGLVPTVAVAYYGEQPIAIIEGPPLCLEVPDLPYPAAFHPDLVAALEAVDDVVSDGRCSRQRSPNRKARSAGSSGSASCGRPRTGPTGSATE